MISGLISRMRLRGKWSKTLKSIPSKNPKAKALSTISSSMATIKNFDFDQTGFEDIKNHPRGRDWPVVYILENGKDIYVGETTTAFGRSKQHFKDEKKLGFKKMHLILDDEFNKSATLDLES